MNNFTICRVPTTQGKWNPTGSTEIYLKYWLFCKFLRNVRSFSLSTLAKTLGFAIFLWLQVDNISSHRAVASDDESKIFSLVMSFPWVMKGGNSTQ